MLTKYSLKKTFANIHWKTFANIQERIAPRLTKYPGWQRAMTFGLQSSCCSCPSCAALGWNHPGLFSATRPPLRTTSGNRLVGKKTVFLTLARTLTQDYFKPKLFFISKPLVLFSLCLNEWAKVKTGLVSCNVFTQSYPVGSRVKRAWK